MCSLQVPSGGERSYVTGGHEPAPYKPATGEPSPPYSAPSYAAPSHNLQAPHGDATSPGHTVKSETDSDNKAPVSEKINSGSFMFRLFFPKTPRMEGFRQESTPDFLERLRGRSKVLAKLVDFATAGTPSPTFKSNPGALAVFITKVDHVASSEIAHVATNARESTFNQIIGNKYFSSYKESVIGALLPGGLPAQIPTTDVLFCKEQLNELKESLGRPVDGTPDAALLAKVKDELRYFSPLRI